MNPPIPPIRQVAADKICVNCVHFLPSRCYDDECTHPKNTELNPVHGHTCFVADPASMRSMGQCGPEGLLFEQKQPKTPGVLLRLLRRLGDLRVA